MSNFLFLFISTVILVLSYWTARTRLSWTCTVILLVKSFRQSHVRIIIVEWGRGSFWEYEMPDNMRKPLISAPWTVCKCLQPHDCDGHKTHPVWDGFYNHSLNLHFPCSLFSPQSSYSHSNDYYLIQFWNTIVHHQIRMDKSLRMDVDYLYELGRCHLCSLSCCMYCILEWDWNTTMQGTDTCA